MLPQALYGCQVRNVRPKDLVPLASQGKAAIISKPPLELNAWSALEVAMGLPLGDSAVAEPIAVARLLQLQWLHCLSNCPGIAGVVHRFVAWSNGAWHEPSLALRSALAALG